MHDERVAGETAPRWGRTAVVVGASMAGLSSAAALAPHFDRVVVLERDELPMGAEHRPSVPQGRHAHTLLAGGLVALERLFPGLGGELASAGAVRIEMNRDMQIEQPPFDPMPKRDFGFVSFGISRPQLEACVRARARMLPAVTILDRTRVLGLVSQPSAAEVRGVRYVHDGEKPNELAADLVVDASGRGELTLELLRELGWQAPRESRAGVDVAYYSMEFERPPDAPRGWTFGFTLPEVPRTTRLALLVPIEGQRWTLSLGGRGDEQPTPENFASFLRELRTPTIRDAIASARRIGEPVRFGFPASRRRHFHELALFPRRLIAIGDSVCRFNPIYGQGMTVAAQQAVALAEGLRAAPQGVDPWTTLRDRLFPAFDALVDGPWNMSVIPDLAYPQTTGERPSDLPAHLERSGQLLRLAVADADVHALLTRVSQLLVPVTELYAELQRRAPA